MPAGVAPFCEVRANPANAWSAPRPEPLSRPSGAARRSVRLLNRGLQNSGDSQRCMRQPSRMPPGGVARSEGSDDTRADLPPSPDGPVGVGAPVMDNLFAFITKFSSKGVRQR